MTGTAWLSIRESFICGLTLVGGNFVRQKSEMRQNNLHNKGHSSAWWVTAATLYHGPSNGSNIAGQSMWFKFT